MSARAGVHDSTAPEAIRTAALMIRIAYSVYFGGHLKAHQKP
jgi:hypothetical protein